MDYKTLGRNSYLPASQGGAGQSAHANAGTPSTTNGVPQVKTSARLNLFGQANPQQEHSTRLVKLFKDPLVQIGLEDAYGTYISWLAKDLNSIVYSGDKDFLAQLCAKLDEMPSDFAQQLTEAADKVHASLEKAKQSLAPALLQNLIALELTLQLVKKVVDKQNPAWRSDDPVAALLLAHDFEFSVMLMTLEHFGSVATEPDLAVRASGKEKKAKEKKAKENKVAESTTKKKKPRKSFLGRLSMRFTTSDAPVQVLVSSANAASPQGDDESEDTRREGDSPVPGGTHESGSEDERRGCTPTPSTTAGNSAGSQNTSS